MEIVFLEKEDLLQIHRHQIDRYGGSHGLRSGELLESAMAMPMATFGSRYLHKDLFEMAAASLYHHVENHPFLDGNKRVGAAAADVFLQLNGYELRAPSDAFYETVMAVAQGRLKKPELAVWIRENARPLE